MRPILHIIYQFHTTEHFWENREIQIKANTLKGYIMLVQTKVTLTNDLYSIDQ